jgi:transcription elongation factor
VFTQDIQECSEVATGKIKLGNFELHDLVTVGTTVGIIIKIERDQFKLLDTTGNVQTVALAAMGAKRNSPKNASTFDANQHTITVGDIVRVTDGQFKVIFLPSKYPHPLLFFPFTGVHPRP